jgi:hypothetical protein
MTGRRQHFFWGKRPIICTDFYRFGNARALIVKADYLTLPYPKQNLQNPQYLVDTEVAGPRQVKVYFATLAASA